MADFGRAIRVIRAARDLAQQDLAANCDLNVSYVSLIESGHRTPSLDTLSVIARELNVPLYLLVLLASEPKDLARIPEKEAQRIGLEVLGLIVGTARGKAVA